MASNSLRRLLRLPYVHAGAIFDQYYERMPWRRTIPAGQRGEQLAARHLKRCGYLILARNYRAAGFEIDLVALDQGNLVFIEVKLRGADGFGRPLEAVDEDKRERIRRAAQAYSERWGVGGLTARFDVVAISANGGRRRVSVIKDAF